MVQSTMTKQDKLWRAEDDARTLISAEEIIKDKSRMSMAMKQAKKIADEAMKRAEAAKRVAKKKK